MPNETIPTQPPTASYAYILPMEEDIADDVDKDDDDFNDYLPCYCKDREEHIKDHDKILKQRQDEDAYIKKKFSEGEVEINIVLSGQIKEDPHLYYLLQKRVDEAFKLT